MLKAISAYKRLLFNRKGLKLVAGHTKGKRPSTHDKHTKDHVSRHPRDNPKPNTKGHVKQRRQKNKNKGILDLIFGN